MTQKAMEQTYYQILELAPSAAHHDIVAAYHKAKLAYSPDSPALYTMFSKEEAQELLALIEEAFRVLSNQTSRREYDNILSSCTLQPTAADLPDFAPAPALVATDEKDVPKKTQSTQQNQPTLSAPAINANTSVPSGFAKSRLSVYEVKEEIENEISTNMQIDGAFLRKIRSYKNINLEQMSRETRISRSYFAAIESDDFEALPAPVFLRGFIIQFARILGLDENRAASSYLSRVKK